MVTGTEMKALKTVAKEDGKTSTRLVSRLLSIDPAYARILCMNLAKGDYLHQETHGCYQITLKGKNALGWSREDRLAPSTGGQAGRVQVEEFHWRTLSPSCLGTQGRAGFFPKPGQEEPGWATMCVGNSRTPRRGR